MIRRTAGVIAALVIIICLGGVVVGEPAINQDTERDRRYAERFKALEDMVNQRFSDQGVAVAAAFAANEKAIQAAFASNEKATAAALAAAKEAVVKAETATEKRFESVNEFRGQLKDQASTLTPRDETKMMEIRLNRLETAQAEVIGVVVFVGALVPIVVVVIAWRLRSTTTKDRET